MRTTTTITEASAAGDERWRLFFALWPPPALAAALHALAGQCSALGGGRAMRVDTLHLTLVFLGEVSPARLPSLRALAATVAGEWQKAQAAAVTLHLDRLGYWPVSGIVHAGMQNPDPALMALADALGEGCRQLGVGLERRRFVPHVTLCRSAKNAPDAVNFTLFDWPLAEFRLVRSRPSSAGADYEILDRWPLRPAFSTSGAG